MALPKRKILSPQHLKAYLESDSCRNLLGFLGKLCVAIMDKTNHPNAIAAEAKLTSKQTTKTDSPSPTAKMPPVIRALEKYVSSIHQPVIRDGITAKCML